MPSQGLPDAAPYPPCLYASVLTKVNQILAVQRLAWMVAVAPRRCFHPILTPVSAGHTQSTAASNGGGSSSSNLAPTANCHQPLFKAKTAAGAASAAAAAVAILSQRPPC